MILRSSRVVLGASVRAADVHIAGGTITRIDTDRWRSPAGRPADRASGRDDVIDVGDLVIAPGIVDTHVHVNEPGRSDWEGFDTATRAAAAGGVTTIVDMPLNSVPATTSVEGLEAKRTAARGGCHVDVGFWGGVIPGNAGQLDALVDAGVRGFKCFLVPSGVDEFPPVTAEDLRPALAIIGRRHVPLLVHAESPEAIRAPDGSRPGSYESYLWTRPAEAEVAAIRLIAALARESGAIVHIVHVSSAQAAEAVADARAQGVSMTAETCPHYLTCTSDQIADGATEWKCAPPIRSARDRDALWEALERGTLDLIATDHSPSPPSLKGRDFLTAWGGIASLELSRAAVWTGLTGRQRADDERAAVAVARWMSEAPARLAGLARKGRIAEGCDADLVVWDPDRQWIVEVSHLQQRHKITPYAGRVLRGIVRATYVRGVRVWDTDRLDHSSIGRLV